MRKGAIAVVGVLLALLVVAAGCGGDDDDSLSAAEFKTQANEICAKRIVEKDKALRAAFADPKGSGIGMGEEAEEKLVTDIALPPLEEMVEELDGVAAPSAQEEKFDKMVAGFDSEMAEMRADPKRALENEVGFFKEPNKLARELRLKDCSSV